MSHINIKKKRCLLIIFVLLEIFIFILFFYKIYQKQIKINKIQNVTKIEKKNIIYPPDTDYKYYWVNKPNAIIEDKRDWLPVVATQTINSDGFNERYNYNVNKDSDTFRIITLGDSVTYGVGVDTKYTWPEQLEDMLNRSDNKCGIKKFEVINLGMASFDIPYLVKRYKTLGAKYNPDYVIWFESGTGFYRFDELTIPYQETCIKEKIAANVKFTLDNVFDCGYEARAAVEKKYTKSELDSILKDSWNDFFTLIDENKFTYLTFDPSDLTPEAVNLLDQWRQYYPSATFSATIPPLSEKERFPDYHPTIQGHQRIAKNMFEYLKKNKLDNCDVNLD